MPTILFIIVFAVPLLAFYFYLAYKEKNKFRTKIGIAVVIALFILAAIIAYFVNLNPPA